jgi:vancomycin resistance protein YoaR
MTDLPDSTSDEETPAGDPELAALVRHDAPAETPASDPELAALVRHEAPPFDADTALFPVAAVTEDEPPLRRRRRGSLVLRFGVAFVVAFLLTAGIGVGVLYAWGQQYEGRVLPGVRVGSTELGGLTREQAEAALTSAYGSLGSGKITLTGPDGQATTIDYADVGRGPNTAAVLDAALKAGRQGEPLANLISGPQVALHGVNLDSAVAYDRDKLTAAVETLATRIDQTPVDAAVAGGLGGTFGVFPAKEGRAVDKAALLTALDHQLGSLDTSDAITMDVPVVSLPPAVATASAQAAKADADRMAADVVVTRNKDSWTIAGKSLAPLISFSTAADGTITTAFDEAGLDPLIKTLAKDVNRKAKDAGLKLVGRRIVATGTSHEGRTLIADGMKAALISEIKARQTGATAAPVEAVVKAVDPKLTTADAKAFAPKMKQISSYSVYYFVIVNNHFGGNIEGPATVINGTVVPAGTKFDFWKTVGDLHNAPGVGPGNAIEGGKITVTGAFGGGICTTSTTLFNAAFRAGMVPIARKNHNEFINRYPPGLDATVWIVGNTKQTMSFMNDTKYPILISRTVTHAGSRRWLTFKIWSVPNGRKATVTGTVIQPGERAINKTVKDPTKPVGYRFFNNAAVDGAKVWTTVTIYDHGKVHWRKRYFSNYPAVDGVTIVGTKT